MDSYGSASDRERGQERKNIMRCRLLMVGLSALAPLWGERQALASEEIGVSASNERAQGRDVSRLLAPILAQHRLPGMVAAIVEGTDVIAAGAVGVRELGRPEKVTLEDRFHIGSCTKAITATLCAILVEEEELSWDSTLAEVFPKLRGKMRPQYRAVTLEQLLTNRGGVPHDLNADGLWRRLWAHRGRPTGARRLLLQGVVARPPEAKPGTKFIYSNGGFSIAGHMAEVVTCSPWETLVRDRIFEPLGMSSGGFGAPGRRARHDQPRGHRPTGEPVQPGPKADNPVAIGPANRVHCSIIDWSKFVALHLRGAQGDARLLTEATFKKLHTPVDDYAMGWMVVSRPWANGRALTHGGSNTYWYAVTWIAPERDFAVLVMCNHGGAAQACDEAVSTLIQDYQQSRR